MLAALVLAAAIASSEPATDTQLAAALDLVYAGSTDTAVARLAEFSAAATRDPMPAYLEALALCWKAEERPDSTDLDAQVHRWADQAIARAEAILAIEPRDSRGWLAKGAAWGVRSRLHLFRRQRGDAVRTAVAMRQSLLRAHELDPSDKDALFGLGLYDYYADVLPRLARVLRFLAGYPGGDRARGLAHIEAARAGSRWHRTEVEAQLYDIYAFYEDAPDQALQIVRGLRARHPGSPLWALRLAEHLRERLGLYAESARVAREIVAASDRGEANYAGVVGSMGRIAEAEALLADLRPEEARRAVESLRVGSALVMAPGVRAILERSRALEADETSRMLARARREHEAGRHDAAGPLFKEVLRRTPRNDEARLRVAEYELELGQRDAAQRRLTELAGRRRVSPPYVRPWTHVLLARVLIASGDAAGAREQYKKVLERPGGLEALRSEAASALDLPAAELGAAPDVVLAF